MENANIEEILKQYWGFDQYLPWQKESMECVLAGRDSLTVLPTGGGKSVCFQAPALMMPGLAVVVSPLISLMKDQVDALVSVGVEAACLNSSLNAAERRAVYEKLQANRLKILYAAPERLVTDEFLALLRSREISFFAVDEAHCISMWGHDFRPEYRGLSILRQAFPEAGIHGFTATATEQVRDDICQALGLQEPEVLVGSFDRPNLIYKVERRSNRIEQIRKVLDRHPKESCIIYCIRRKDVDSIATSLAGRGYSALPYHAGMSDGDRKGNQEAFARDEVEIIVATIAFGMGIDKSNVRCVIHAGAPKSLEHYQQETGRAGRDGLEAECRLFFSGGDFITWRGLLENMDPEAQAVAHQKIHDMGNYCSGLVCRHRALVRYFGQDLEKDNCEACDVCLGDLDLAEDPLILSQKILSCVVRLRQRFGAQYTASVLVGYKDKRILENGHDNLSTWGLLSEEGIRNVRDWVEQLVDQGYLAKVGDYNVLQMTPSGWEAIKGEVTPLLLTPAKKAAKVETVKVSKTSWEDVDRDLFEALRGLRHKLAQELGKPAYVVFSDAALRDMARQKPDSPETFLQVHGVGQKKCEVYGKAFLAAIADHKKEGQTPKNSDSHLFSNEENR